MHRHLAPLLDPRVEADPGPFGRRVVEDAPGRGQVVAGGVLRVEPALEGVSARAHLLLLEGQGPPGRHLELEADEVVARSPPPSPRAPPAGACSSPGSRSGPAASSRNSTVPAFAVARGPGGRHARRAQRSRRRAGVRPGLGVSSTTFWCRRWIEHSRSKRWITWPVVVGQDLDLDVPRALRDASRGRGCRHRRTPSASRRQAARAAAEVLAARPPPACPCPPPPREGLIMTGQPIRAASASRVASVLVVAVVAGDDGHPGRGHEPARALLVAHAPVHVARGAHEDEAGLRHRVGEVAVLAQEAVAGVDGVGSAGPGRVEDGRRCSGTSGPPPPGRWPTPRRRPAEVARPRVGLGVDRHRLQAHDPSRCGPPAPRSRPGWR